MTTRKYFKNWLTQKGQHKTVYPIKFVGYQRNSLGYDTKLTHNDESYKCELWECMDATGEHLILKFRSEPIEKERKNYLKNHINSHLKSNITDYPDPITCTLEECKQNKINNREERIPQKHIESIKKLKMLSEKKLNSGMKKAINQYLKFKVSMDYSDYLLWNRNPQTLKKAIYQKLLKIEL